MIVKVNYRKPKRKSSIKWMIFTFCGMFLGIMAFSFSSEDDFLYLYNLNNQVLQKTKVYQLVSNQYEDWGGDEDQMPAYNTGGTTTATSGTGLNLLLINNIQTEGYVKEYLTIAAENQEGKLDTAERAAYASVETIIGINCGESKFYPAGDGMTLPKQDLPIDSDGAPKWDGSKYSLKNWNYSDHLREGYSADPGGPFQYVDSGAWTGLDAFSIYHKEGSATPNGSSDAINFGDAICGINNYMQIGADTLGLDMSNTDDKVLAMLGSLTHMRGGGGTYMFFGFPYNKLYHKSTDVRNNYLNLDASSSEEISSCVKDTLDAGTAVLKDWDPADIQQLVSGTHWSSVVPFIASGWTVSNDFVSSAKSHLSGRTLDAFIFAWNALLPDEPVSDYNSAITALSKHSGKLSTALGISDSECDRIYCTVDGEYKHYTTTSPGDLFYVTNKTTNLYSRQPGAKLVYSVEALWGERIVTCFSMGSYVYAKMLKYAGVDVDPTNPDTYMNKFSGDGWSSVSTEYQDVLKANGLDTSKLTDERAKIVNVAASYLGTKYLQCRNGGGQDGALCDGFCYNNMDAKATHLDCSAFIWRCYKEAGFDCTGFPTNTGGYTTNDGVLVETTVDQLKPGDVIWFSHGHVELYLGQDDSTIYYIHESTWGVGCVYGTHRKEGFPGKGCKLYRYTRFENE